MQIVSTTFRTVIFALALLCGASVMAADPLPSWDSGATKTAITNFIAQVARKGSTDSVEPAEHIAVFDNDGTLWAEQPVYFQFAFTAHRIQRLAPEHPEWKTKQPFKGVLENDPKAVAGGLDGAEYAWWDEFTPNDRQMANTWQGHFPHENLVLDGYERTSPVRTFDANGYGLHDMIGNVWEWTIDWFSPKHTADVSKACCTPRNPRGGRMQESYDACRAEVKIPRKVLKGGSFLCAPNYCRRYRPAARHAQPIDTSTCHVGFRCVARATPT